MNPDPELFADASRRIPEIERRIVDEAVLSGKKHAAAIVQDPATREYVARMALTEAMAAQGTRGTSDRKRPAVTAPPKVSARKRQRQARKANRGR